MCHVKQQLCSSVDNRRQGCERVKHRMWMTPGHPHLLKITNLLDVQGLDNSVLNKPPLNRGNARFSTIHSITTTTRFINNY
jgi:hypothetical protein